MEVSVRVVSNRLGDLAAQLRQRAGDVVQETALDIANEAKERVPKETGNLARSIHVEAAGELEAQVGTDVEYARRIEFGFVGADSLGRVYDQAPQPYLTPAAEAARPEFERKMRGLFQ